MHKEGHVGKNSLRHFKEWESRKNNRIDNPHKSDDLNRVPKNHKNESDSKGDPRRSNDSGL